MDSYYDDEAAPSGAQDSKPKDGGDKKRKSEGQSALLPKSILAGKEFKPGEEIVLKIEHIFDDEVEVSYSYGDEKEGKDEGESDGEGEPAMADKGEPEPEDSMMM
jgi:hypothetical protein